MNNNKRFLYVGGLADEVDVNLLRTTFSTFGDIIDINLPMDYSAQKHKGFAFIEFQWPEDAADAIDNMDNGELLGKTIRINIAKPQRFHNQQAIESSLEQPMIESDMTVGEGDT